MEKNGFCKECNSYILLKAFRVMRITLFLILVLSLQTFANEAYSQKTRLSLDATNQKLVNVLDEIEDQTEFYFLYNEKLIDTQREVSINVHNKKIDEILDELFVGTDVKYTITNRKIILAPSYLSEPAQQQKSVSGTVTDESGQALPGVTVLIKGTTQGTITNADGKYTLANVPTESTLVFSFIGMRTQEVEVNNQSNVDMTLTTDAIGVDEVVVIGYGSRAKKDVTTSISTVDSKEITKSITMSPEMAMQGRMTGVYVSGNTGNPMDRPTVRIRGVNTWGVASPLYVIDGVPVTELGSGIEGQEDDRISDVRGPINIMAMIDPNDIESISVLKDASAAAIYGVRAANGVILITTKKGNTEVPTIEFNARYGIQNVVKTWDVMNTQQYTDFYKKSFAANPNFALDGVFDPSSPEYLGDTKETYDWQNAILNKNAPNQDYSVRISGKTKATNYYASGSYASQEGVVNDVNLERYSFNLKLDNQFNKWLKTGINYRLAYVEGRDQGASITDRAETPPWQPIYDANAPEILKGFARAVPGYDASGKWVATKLYGEGTRINTIGQNALNDQRYNSLRNLGNTFVEITPLKGLSVKGSVSIDWYKNDRYSFKDYNSAYFTYTGGSPTDEGGGKSVGKYGERYVTNFNIVKELTINYHKSFGEHNIDLLANGMDQQYSAKYVGAETQYMTTKESYLWALGGENEYTMIESENFRWALQGLLGRISYNYASKYYIDATVRRDGSNRFAPGHRWGTFPSASLAWRMTSESFMKNISWLTDLKFRAGWGQLGNQEVRPMAYLSPIEKRPTYAFGSNPGSDGLGNYGVGAAMFSFPNPDLEWEKTTTTNVGFDIILFNNLSGSVEYYHKKTDGILQETSIPPSVGSKQNPVANIASVQNQGFEMSLNYNNKIGQVTYNIGANITTVKNEVLSTYKGIPLGGNLRIEEGYPMNYIYGYKEGGIFQNQQEIDAYTATTEDLTISQNFQPGDRYFLDINGEPNAESGNPFYTPGPDGVVNQYDRTYLGKTIPGYYYGFNLGLNYKGFDFSAFFQGVGDVQKYNSAYATMMQTATRGNNRLVDVLNAWTPENHSTTIARAVVGDPNGSLRYSSRYVEDASYLRLSNIQLGYTLPESLLTALRNNVKYLRIYTSLTNAFTITGWNGLDPENDNQPVPRVFNFGISAKF